MNTKKIDGYKIKQYYKEFKDFIGCTASLPQIKPIKIYYDNNILAYVDLNEIRQEEIPLYYTDELVKQPIQCVKSKIFHEFTHIYDANIQFANMSSNSLADIMNTYSEFHASQVEMLVALGYKKFPTQRVKFNDSTKLFSMNEYKVPYEYVLDELNYCLIEYPEIDEYSSLTDTEFLQRFYKSLKHMMYFLGKYYIYQNLHENARNINFKIFGDFADAISTAYKILCSKRAYDENYIGMSTWLEIYERQFFNYYGFVQYPKVISD